MTPTESMLLRAVLESPGDDTPRLAYADWLDDNAGVVPCPICTGPGFPRGPVPVGCTKCRGSLEISDGRRERAEFIRVQIEIADQFADLKSECVCKSAEDKFHCSRCMAWDQSEAIRERERKLWNRYKCQWFGDSWAVLYLDSDGEDACGQYLSEAIVGRGFVSTVRTPLAVLVGGECGRCAGHGTAERNGSDYTCRDCHGTGRVGGIGRELFERQPVERIVVTDVRPGTTDRGPEFRNYFCWEAEPFSPLWFVMRSGLLLCGHDSWRETEEECMTDLSAALVAHFREQAGLTPLA